MGRKPRPEQLPEVIRRLTAKRIAKGLTRTALAEQLGYSYDSIQKWEAGRIHPSFQSLLNWCEFFGVTLTVMEPRNDRLD